MPRLVRVSTANDINRPAVATAQRRFSFARRNHSAIMSMAVAGSSVLVGWPISVAQMAMNISPPSPDEIGSVQRRATPKTAMQDAKIHKSPNSRTAHRDSPKTTITPASMRKINGGLVTISST